MSLKPGPGLLGVAALAVVILAAAILTPADADLWGHLKFGADIVADHHVVQIDRYSFTTDRPWVNHEWLSEVLFALAYRFGPAGLILLKVAIVVSFLALLATYLARLKAPIGLIAV